MNNSQASALNEWLILIGTIFFIIILIYLLFRLMKSAYKLINPIRPVILVDMSNVVHLAKVRGRLRR